MADGVIYRTAEYRCAKHPQLVYLRLRIPPGLAPISAIQLCPVCASEMQQRRPKELTR